MIFNVPVVILTPECGCLHLFNVTCTFACFVEFVVLCCQGMLNDYKHKVALLQEATDKLTSDLAEKDTFISVSVAIISSYLEIGL